MATAHRLPIARQRVRQAPQRPRTRYGTWLHSAPVFKEWLQAPSAGCLHLRGIAGSGKSVLAASTVQWLQDKRKNSPTLFFFRQIVDKNHSTAYLVRDFAAQLLPFCPGLVTRLEEVCKTVGGLDGREAGELWDAVLQSGLSALPQVHCIVDALDEMDDTPQNQDIIRRLVNTAEKKPESVKVLFTGRPLPRIQEKMLPGQHVLRQRLDTSLLCPDVATYVSVSMATLNPLLSPEIGLSCSIAV